MGWSVGEAPANLKEFLRDLLSGESPESRSRCVDIAIKLTAAYAAVETTKLATGEKEIWAAVVMLRRYGGKESPELGYKLVDENSGPIDEDCPKRILKLLTPTSNEYASQWRARCWQKIEYRQKAKGLQPGKTIEYDRSIRFTDGYEARRFTVVSIPGRRGRHRKVLRGENGGLYRMPPAPQRSDWRVVSGLGSP